MILIDFVLKKDKSYYSQVFLGKSKYIETEKKMIRYTNDKLENVSDDSEKELFSFEKRLKKFKSINLGYINFFLL